ncbi:MAG TPA: class I SAM-dependent methyltransferase [Noviherbaspirillum sp.]
MDRPSAWVVRFAPLIPVGEVLDLACGGGRHARLLAGLGHSVLAVDRDPAALAATAGEGIRVQQFDLERDGMTWPFEDERFAGIVVTNYLHRPLFPHLFRSLAPDGVLVYETFAQGNEQFGKPSNPDFLLASGELLTTIAAANSPDLAIVAYEDGYIDTPKPAMVQRICVWKAVSGAAPTRRKL